MTTLSVRARDFYVDAGKGDDTRAGTIQAPWRTLRNSIPRLQPGDTLYLRKGVFPEKEIAVAVSGTSAAPIAIRAFPGESPVVDGGMGAFREPANDDWELVDDTLQIFASKRTFADPTILHGYFDFAGVQYKLVGYDDYAALAARSQFSSPAVPFYIGPGVHWRKTDRRIYIRLVQSDIARENGYALPGLPTDPRALRILLWGDGAILRVAKSAAHINFEGLIVQGQGYPLLVEPGGASHLVVRDCRFLGGRYHIVLGRGTHHVLMDGVSIDGAVPDWIAWLDVKEGRRPGRHLETPGIKITAGVHDIEIRNSSFLRLFDGINSNDGGSNVYIHHNLFESIRDDCYQLGTATHDVEFAHNRMIHISKGPGFMGRGDSSRPGTKYFHHNIIDCTKRWLFARRNADGSVAKLQRNRFISDHGEVWTRPVGFHGPRALDPWKIYQNTIVFGQETNASGNGLEYPHGSHFDPAVPQEVYNNVIVEISDYWVSSGARVADGSQIFDGNLYYRVPGSATLPLIHAWSGVHGPRDFDSLAEFKASSLFAESRARYAPGFEHSGVEGDPGLDAAYRPAADGPAATGAVPLPKDWPGNQREKFRGALSPARNDHGQR